MTFPVTAKQSIVNGDKRHALYHYIADEFGEGALPKWNFAKYLIGKDGTVKGAFPEHMSPRDPQVVAAILRELNVGHTVGGTMNLA